ncbi:methylated DNA-protein cysteine methyltransferase [Pyrenophora tritici-repentis]|uniref:DNA binding domain containing protein n=1 Tax=Pyrenophora tritici-repentis TaxID=45151 RepID=A0A2W1E2B7_9PLEO|nr:methylated DNA-protein cysteine methyltransferase [Pyrenophora tritici-repentis]KAF7443651.1 methylated DNA-protein cysteine methyltransferase [Pyrenophora tritici-repentis]KAF7566632.1 methylated DNA-protein cysteine methyltransferase [Pyrenophora tritici-repentis]KAG9379389.1 methylated DNA-protein cysteine methyltransferase [Pyrenophora tritici-repentis]KAI0578537.1 methylated DNA-protein cysteine methyltransferase [Pyrenophora tritici-repentis]
MTPGERSEEAWLWHTAVCEAIQEIPHGKVTSYGHIAMLVGKPDCPRQVGVCLKNLPSESADGSNGSRTFHSGNVPWQRVINAKGGISPRGPSAAAHQADALRREGVEVRQDAMGLYTVDLDEYGWFPDMLPSEAALVESSDGEDADEDTNKAA